MRALPSLGLIALLSACAVQYRTEAPYSSDSPTAYPSDSPYGAPLRARILNVDGRLRVSTSRPAHIAIFEIVPGQGVGLLYPAFEWEDNYLSGGINALRISQTRPYYPYFTSATARGRWRAGGPRYLYMVASDAPLRLSRFIDSPGLLRRSLGLTQFASANPYGMLDQLAGLVLPFDGAGEWTDDLFVIYPERHYGYDTRYHAAQWLRVRCPDGRVIAGPSYYVFNACDTSGGIPPLRTNPREPGQPGDTTQVQEPTRKRPEPRGAEPGSSTEEGETRFAPRDPIIEVIPEPTERIRPTPEEQRGPAEPRAAEWTRISERDGSDPRRADPRVDPQVENRPESSEPRFEPRSQPRVEPRQEPREEPRFEPRQEPRVEPRQEPRAEPRQEPRYEPRSEPRAEPRQEPRAEPRQEPRETPRVESRPEPRVEAPRVEIPRSAPPSERPSEPQS